MNGHKIINQSSLDFLTFTVVGWVDVFSRPAYKNIIIDSFKYGTKNKGLKVHAYVIMTNHIHVIFSAQDGLQLSDIVRDFKKFTSKKILETTDGRGLQPRSNMLILT